MPDLSVVFPVYNEDLTISKADFPTVPDRGVGYVTTLRQMLSGQPLTIALDRLQAELEVERMEDSTRIVSVKNDPPRIIVSQVPALLVRIDGKPVLRSVAGTDPECRQRFGAHGFTVRTARLSMRVCRGNCGIRGSIAPWVMSPSTNQRSRFQREPG